MRGDRPLIFQLVFVAAFVWAAVVGARAASRAVRLHGGSINQLANEARGLVVMRAALGLVFYAALGSWLFAPSAFAWAYLSVPTALRWAAAALLVPALAFFTWSYATLGGNYRGGIGLYEQHELVTRGPYAIVRHPIYLAFIVIMLLVLPLTANWIVGMSGLALVSLIALVRIPQEERQLRERFGAAWTAYASRTGRLLPVSGNRSRDERD